MKTIGLLGGTSWPSIPLYYTYLNQRVSEMLGGFHSAKIILYSIDYHPIKSLYPDGWEDIPELLGQELKALDEMGPDCILICNNTLHKGYDILVENQEIALMGQIIHIVVATAKKAVDMGVKRVLLLGTKFTMEDGFFVDRLKFFGLDVEIPSEEDRDAIQAMQTEISAGRIQDDFKTRFKDILSRYDHNEAVILGCTELPMVVSERETDMQIISSIHAQCDEALKMVWASVNR